MAKLTTKKRRKLKDSDFCILYRDGTRKYPIYDIAHARNALARVEQHGKDYEKIMVKGAVYRRYPELRPPGYLPYKTRMFLNRQQVRITPKRPRLRR